MANYKNPLYTGDPLEWEMLSLAEKIEFIRLDDCTGPCGQGMATRNRSARINAALREVLTILRDLSPPADRPQPEEM